MLAWTIRENKPCSYTRTTAHILIVIQDSHEIKYPLILRQKCNCNALPKQIRQKKTKRIIFYEEKPILLQFLFSNILIFLEKIFGQTS